ncbi:hypothetical protein [uncultured Rikenella sp.]|uniref:hypothetical protein n=1 Tax=uncultured Rikenella sp. TaxID=368003 RepID=UPI0025D8831F|nr:hypothetical protein [uncultured Rikenella sp.]
MDNLTIWRAGAELYHLPAGTKLELSQKLMAEQTITYDVAVASPLDLRAGDYVEWQEVRYSLFEEPDYKHTAGVYTYNLRFYAPYHRLSHILHKDEGATSFAYFGSVREHLEALLKSVQAIDPEFKLGTIDENGSQLLEFADTYCLDALTQICEAFKMQWEVENKTINVQRRIGVDTSYRFAYGCGQGLYSLDKAGVTNASVATRLYGRGAAQNLPPRYRETDTPMPDTLVFADRYLEKNTDKYGIREDIATFEEIFPRLKDATLTSVTVPDDVNKATGWSVQVSLPFDLNDCLSEDEAQIKFTSGELTGEGFTISHYDHTTGLLQFNVSEDNGYSLPSATRQPHAGDGYVLLNIIMPEAYVQAAEEELREATQKELERRCEKRYAYTLAVDPRYVRQHGIQLHPGDSVVVCGTPQAAGTSIRVTQITYPLYDPHRLEITLSDTVLYSSYAEKIENDIRDVTHEVNNVHRESRTFSRRAWRDAEELARLIDALRTELLLVGNLAGQFALTSTFAVNQNNTRNLFSATGGTLQHAVYKGATEGVWQLGGVNLTLESDLPYYLYARCSRTSSNGFFYATTEKIEPEAVEGWYHFPVGVISSPFEGARVFNTTYGFTQISGGSVTTGCMRDKTGRLEIDLDNGTITGPVKFNEGSAGLNEVKEWKENFTAIKGGLLLTSLIKMLTDGIETGGLSTGRDNVLLWGGGTYADALANLAKIILRHDGSGQLAGGKIWWNAQGDLILKEGAEIGKFKIVNGGLDWETGGLIEGDIVTPYGHFKINPDAIGPILEVRGSGISTMKVYGGFLLQYGCIQCFGLELRSVSRDYTIDEFDSVIVCDNTDKITITLPEDPYPGRMIYIRRNYSGAVDVKTADGFLIRKGSSEFASHAIGGVGWTHVYIFHYEGYQKYRWLMNLITH